MDWRKVPLPPRMASLAKDRRGLPVPFGVLVTQDGTPHFTINDSEKVARVIRERRCAICGNKLHGRSMWFVGGPMSAFHDAGGYVDPPLHYECADYALKVCPYLAAPKYAGRLDDATLKPEQVEADGVMTLVDPTSWPDRPDVFVAARTTDYTVTRGAAGPVMIPKRPWGMVKFYRHGEELTDIAAAPYIRASFAKLPPPERRVPRGVIGQVVGQRMVGEEAPPKGDDR